MRRAVPPERAAARLEIRLFGQAGVRFDGQPLKLARRSITLAMFALILLRRGEAIARDSLAFTLFPDQDEASALAELRRCIYLANKSLPQPEVEPWLIADAETIRWNDAAGAFVDVIAFEQFCATPETYADAIALYTGDLLESVYDDWVVTERERFRSRYLAVLDESIAHNRARRDFPAAIACAKRVLAADAWREDTLRTLLALRYESGDTAGALAEYEAFARRLRDELDASPMPETVAVRASILRSDRIPGSLERSPVTEPSERKLSIAPLPFVGRRRELGVLEAAWTAAARGRGAFVVVSGEAGVGKTRLTAELVASAQLQGARVLVGTTAAPESVPYQAISEALRSGLPLLLSRPPAPARRATLARLLPELRSSDAPDVALPELPSERETARIFDALIHAIRALASPRPLLLVLEDLQWAGPATLDALGAVVRESMQTSILIVATAREEETPADHPLRALQRALRGYPNVDEIALQRLEERDVAELVERVEALRAHGQTLARDLFAHSEGNALFLNEAISSVIERKATTLSDETAGSIARVIEERVVSLSDDARAVAEIAAVAGSGCSVALTRNVANLPATAIARGFDELLDRRIVREAGARTGHDYVFTHHLIARAIYDTIEPVFRSARHLRIARILEAEHVETQVASARDIARHYELAGEVGRAADWYLESARRATVVHAYGDAIDLATLAVENAPSAELRRAALEIRERALGRRGDRARQRDDIDALDALAGNDARSRFDVLTRRILLARNLGESQEEGRLITEVEEIAQSLDESAQAQAYAQRAAFLGVLSRQAEAIGPAHSALEIYERLGDLQGQLECLCLLVDFSANVGAVADSREYLARMRERAASRSDRAVEAKALAVAATAVLARGEYRECLELSTLALERQIVTGDREGEAYSRGRIAAAASRLDDFSTALREFDRTLETYESIGHKRGVALTHTNRTTLLMRLGLFDEALRSIERSNVLLEVVQEQRMVACNHVNASFVRLQLGDVRAAKAAAELALPLARLIRFPVFEAAALANLGNAERGLGNVRAAIELMQAGIAIRRPIQAPRDFVDDLADLTFAFVEAGDGIRAIATAYELREIGNGSFDGAFWSHYIWWAVAHGYQSGGAAVESHEALCRAVEQLRAFAERIEDTRVRAAFLSIPVNRRIMAGRLVQRVPSQA